jgi:hypothetical protein
MRKSQGIIGVLVFSLSLLVTMAINERTHAAGIYCNDLKKCSGEAGCPSGGSLSGCTLTCVNGGYAYCNSNGGGDDDDFLIE